jgi:glycosyltransferase involved in cell wall biosynthesis
MSSFKFSSENRIKIRVEYSISDDSVLVGFVGRFAAVKNLISLLEAFSDVSNEFPAVYLLLVGTGAQENDLKDLARARGIQSKVIFAGLRADVGKILSALDIFVLPSFTEGLSTSLLEAMSVARN